MEFVCDECGCTEYLDREGSGTDEYGDFTDYWCKECESLVRMYENEYDISDTSEDDGDFCFNCKGTSFTVDKSGNIRCLSCNEIQKYL